MTTLYDQLEARIDRFGDVPWPAEMSLREWQSAQATLYSTALFHLLGVLSSMAKPDRPAPTKGKIAWAITASLDHAQPETAQPDVTGAPTAA